MAADPRSVLTRTGPAPDLVLRYGTGDDHLVDVHLPPGPPTPRPVVVLLHGGFWRREFDRTHTRPLAHALRAAGYVVASPEYTRSSRGRPGRPGTFDDVTAVRLRLPTLLAETAPGRADAAPVTVLGHSAGGHLALWWALTAPPELAPARVVALAPVADLARAYAEDLDDGAVRDLLGGGPREHPDRYATADVAPMLPGYAGPADLQVLHGDRDDRVPVAHSRSLAGVRLHELPGAGHFAPIDPLSPAWPYVRVAVQGGARPCDPD
ncbi:MAG: alpha/beta hydrolase family protein [Nocardioidaceae bacterium]